jgi:hypothetical protein
VLLTALALLAGLPARADDAFAIQRIEPATRVVQADIDDLDGDGLGDLLWTGVEGLPPDERRSLHVHFGRTGDLPALPDLSLPVPSGTAAYDLAEVDGRPGAELLLLRRDRVTRLSFHGRTPVSFDLLVPGGPTIAAVEDERGMDRLALVRRGIGAAARVLIPGFGRAFLLETDGTPVATLDVGARANYFIPPRPGPLISESEIEIYFDHPRLDVGDVDGDGRADLLASSRHELRVFLQREGGGFVGTPDREVALKRLSLEDHIRTSGSVRVMFHDFDQDGRIDLLLCVSTGSIFGGTTQLTLHRNVGGTWNLDAPDQRFETQRGFTTHDLIDLDGDGRAELVSVRIPTGVLEVVEVLVTRAIDALVTVHRRGEDTPFDPKPWITSKQDVGISFETLRATGFIPNSKADVNGDGRRDLLGSGDGDRLELRLGDPEKGFERHTTHQDLDTGGRIRFGDLDGNASADFVIYDPRRPGTPLRVGTSLLGKPAPQLLPGPE